MSKTPNKLAKLISFTDDGSSVLVGSLPPNSIITSIIVLVGTAFDGDTTNTVDIGSGADPDRYANDVALGTEGNIAVTQLNTGEVESSLGSTAIFAAVTSTASAAAGSAYVVVEYAQL